MYVTLVYVHVKPGFEDRFAEASRENADCSLEEPGNVLFELLQQADDPTRFVFYEAYENKEFAAAHKDTPHYQKWRDTVADWMAEPRKGVAHAGVRCWGLESRIAKDAKRGEGHEKTLSWGRG